MVLRLFDRAQRERARGRRCALAEGDEDLEVVAGLAEVEHRAVAEPLVAPDCWQPQMRRPRCERPRHVTIVEDNDVRRPGGAGRETVWLSNPERAYRNAVIGAERRVPARRVAELEAGDQALDGVPG